MKDEENVVEEETTDAVDSVAREEIRKLQERFEGGRLVPGFSLIFRKAVSSITGWSGWETIGVGCGFTTLVVGIIFGVIMAGQSCASHEQTIIERREEHVRERFQPVCEAMGLEFVTIQSVQVINNSGTNICEGEFCPGSVETVVCAGEDRVVTINARDISQTTVHTLE